MRPLHDRVGAHGGDPLRAPDPAAGRLRGRPALDPLAGRDTAGEAFHGLLEPGAAARFAVFAVADEAELLVRGATTCVATVIGGRLLHRRR